MGNPPTSDTDQKLSEKFANLKTDKTVFSLYTSVFTTILESVGTISI